MKNITRRDDVDTASRIKVPIGAKCWWSGPDPRA